MRSRFLADKIELWSTEKLVPSARNARTHSDKQVAEIAGSIAAYGFIAPVVVDCDGGLMAGHGRVLAARKLGLANIPVIVIHHLSELDQRAYALADNKITQNAGWDDALLKIELAALASEGIDLQTLGFDQEELDDLLTNLENAIMADDEDSAPAVPEKTVTRPGKIWKMAEHRLLCGDATEEQSYLRLLVDARADLVFTDPPYNVAYRRRPTLSGNDRAIANDDLGSEFRTFLRRACTHMLRFTDGALYICMASSELHSLYSAFVEAGGHWSTFLIWGKSTFTLGRADYQRQYEPILYGWREGTAHHWCGARDQGDLWLLDKPRVNDLHPTMKPVALIERAVVNSSRRGGLVLDPFAGSGSTLIVCEKNARKARLMELDPAYCDVIVQRWQQATGKSAIDSETGRSFEQIANDTLRDADVVLAAGCVSSDQMPEHVNG